MYAVEDVLKITLEVSKVIMLALVIDEMLKSFLFDVLGLLCFDHLTKRESVSNFKTKFEKNDKHKNNGLTAHQKIIFFFL